jgi:hypothetical protein
VGETGSNKDHSANPTFLFDNILRVGGYYNNKVHADVSLLVNSNDVVSDKIWVWRADHAVGSGAIDWNQNTTKNGSVILGDRVTAYGYFVEHQHEYNSLWLGEDGHMFFFQNEAPYDPHWQRQFMSHGGAVNGYSTYKVGHKVTKHKAYGLGSYCVFLFRTNGIKQPEGIIIQNAIEVPHGPDISVEKFANVYIGMPNAGGFEHTINGVGGPTKNSYNENYTSYVNGKITWSYGNHTGGWNFEDIEDAITGQSGTEPGPETHWVEELVISAQGTVDKNPKGGIGNVAALK